MSDFPTQAGCPICQKWGAKFGPCGFHERHPDKAAPPSVGAVPQGGRLRELESRLRINADVMDRGGMQLAVAGTMRNAADAIATLRALPDALSALSAKWRGQANNLRRIAEGISTPEILLREAKEIEEYAAAIDALLRGDG